MDGVCIDSSVIGNNVTISQNTVIGKNGFGYDPFFNVNNLDDLEKAKRIYKEFFHKKGRIE